MLTGWRLGLPTRENVDGTHVDVAARRTTNGEVGPAAVVDAGVRIDG